MTIEKLTIVRFLLFKDVFICTATDIESITIAPEIMRQQIEHV